MSAPLPGSTSDDSSAATNSIKRKGDSLDSNGPGSLQGTKHRKTPIEEVYPVVTCVPDHEEKDHETVNTEQTHDSQLVKQRGLTSATASESQEQARCESDLEALAKYDLVPENADGASTVRHCFCCADDNEYESNQTNGYVNERARDKIDPRLLQSFPSQKLNSRDKNIKNYS